MYIYDRTLTGGYRVAMWLQYRRHYCSDDKKKAHWFHFHRIFKTFYSIPFLFPNWFADIVLKKLYCFLFFFWSILMGFLYRFFSPRFYLLSSVSNIFYLSRIQLIILVFLILFFRIFSRKRFPFIYRLGFDIGFDLPIFYYTLHTVRIFLVESTGRSSNPNGNSHLKCFPNQKAFSTKIISALRSYFLVFLCEVMIKSQLS